jgi:hypothetical protein
LVQTVEGVMRFVILAGLLVALQGCAASPQQQLRYSYVISLRAWQDCMQEFADRPALCADYRRKMLADEAQLNAQALTARRR